MLSHGTYKLGDSKFKSPQISLNLKSKKIWLQKNKALYGIDFVILHNYPLPVCFIQMFQTLRQRQKDHLLTAREQHVHTNIQTLSHMTINHQNGHKHWRSHDLHKASFWYSSDWGQYECVNYEQESDSNIKCCYCSGRKLTWKRSNCSMHILRKWLSPLGVDSIQSLFEKLPNCDLGSVLNWNSPTTSSIDF